MVKRETLSDSTAADAGIALLLGVVGRVLFTGDWAVVGFIAGAVLGLTASVAWRWRRGEGSVAEVSIIVGLRFLFGLSIIVAMLASVMLAAPHGLRAFQVLGPTVLFASATAWLVHRLVVRLSKSKARQPSEP